MPPPKSSIDMYPEGKINIVRDNSLDIKAVVDSDKSAQLIVNKFYFPGWHVFVDGKDKPLDYSFSIDGIFRTEVSAGKHTINVVYKKTRIMWLADLISISSFGILLYCLWAVIRNKKLLRHGHTTRSQ